MLGGSGGGHEAWQKTIRTLRGLPKDIRAGATYMKVPVMSSKSSSSILVFSDHSLQFSCPQIINMS